MNLFLFKGEHVCSILEMRYFHEAKPITQLITIWIFIKHTQAQVYVDMHTKPKLSMNMLGTRSNASLRNKLVVGYMMCIDIEMEPNKKGLQNNRRSFSSTSLPYLWRLFFIQNTLFYHLLHKLAANQSRDDLVQHRRCKFCWNRKL